MTLAKQTIVDRIEVCEGNTIQVRQVTRITEGDTLLSESFHRYTIHPGDDLNGQDPRVAAIANVLWVDAPPSTEPTGEEPPAS